jgi:hypothetical protein
VLGHRDVLALIPSDLLGGQLGLLPVMFGGGFNAGRVVLLPLPALILGMGPPHCREAETWCRRDGERPYLLGRQRRRGYIATTPPAPRRNQPVVIGNDVGSGFDHRGNMLPSGGGRKVLRGRISSMVGVPRTPRGLSVLGSTFSRL